MPPYVEWRQRDISQHVLQESISIKTAVAERSTAQLTMRLDEGESIADPRLVITGANRLVIADGNRLLLFDPGGLLPADFDEITIDDPGLPYRAAVERTGADHYWRLDEPTGRTTARDFIGSANLTYALPANTSYQHMRDDAAAVPYGAAPRFNQTTGTALTGTLPASTSTTWAVGGFARLTGVGTAERVLFSHADVRLIWRADGQVRFVARGAATTAAATYSADRWRHFALLAYADRTELWIDGVRAAMRSAGSASTLTGAISLAVVSTGSANLWLDEWAVWPAPPDVADLTARARHRRLFGGYVFGLADLVGRGERTHHTVELPLSGYGLRLDKSFVRRTFVSSTGLTVSEIVDDVLTRAGLSGVFSADGVLLTDTLTRAVYPVSSVADTLRQLERLYGAVLTVDPAWPVIEMVKRESVYDSGVSLSAAANGNVSMVGRSTKPRFFASRVIVEGRGELGTVIDSFTTDGVARSWDLKLPPEQIITVELDDVAQSWSGDGRTFDVDHESATISMAEGVATIASGKTIRVTYSASAAIVAEAANTTARDAIGFDVTVVVRDDAIDTQETAAARAAAELAVRAQEVEHYEAACIYGRVDHVRPGRIIRTLFPKFAESRDMLSESVGISYMEGGDGVANAVYQVELTPQDFQGSAGDYWRGLVGAKPPAPRQIALTEAQDPIDIRPGDISIPAGLPLDLGGEWAEGVTSSSWTIPSSARWVRVNGGDLDKPLACDAMGLCAPSGTLGAGDKIQLQLYDRTNSTNIGNVMEWTTTSAALVGQRRINLPARVFDLTYRVRLVSGLRAGKVWGVKVTLDYLA